MRKTALAVGALVLLGYCGSTATDASGPAAGSDPTGTPARAAQDPPDSSGAAGENRDETTRERATDTEPRRRTPREAQARPAGSTQQTQPRRRTEHRSQKPPVRRYPVLDVVDGDTVDVAYRGSEVSVRVIGIDTPETVHPSVPVECGGPEASATATRLLAGKRVGLVFDPSQGRTDAYGRTLAYLQVPGVGDFGLAMIRRGHAAEYTYDTSYAHQARYLAAQATAQARGRGIWDGCGGVDTPLGGAEGTGNRSEPNKPRPLVQHGGRGGGNCDPGYDPCVPPYPPDLDCADVDGPIRVLGDDPHGFDADGDGIGCDS